MKSDKLFNATNSLIIGIGLVILGLLVFIGRYKLYVNVVNIFLLAVLFLSLKQFVDYFAGRKKDKNLNFTRCFINLFFCLICSLIRDIPMSILPIIFGLYLLLNSIIKFINYTVILKGKVNGKLTELALGIFYLVISIPIIFSPLKYLNVILMFIGIYIILLGVNYIFDFISSLIPVKIKNKIKRNIRISLPTFIEAIIPYVVLREINYLLDKENYDKPIVLSEKKDEYIDIEVFVHTSNRGFNRMGHVDLCYDGKIISYGNYDDSSVKFFTMLGDGVLFITEREKYIPFCIEHSKKMIFAFGLKLNEKQKNEIEKAIKDIFKDAYSWDSPYQESIQQKKKTTKKKFGDYASCLHQVTDAKFYKLKRGRFKKYFVLGNNCCRLADYVIGKNGIDILRMTGIITPGAYYDYLNREFQKKHSIVVSRKIYNNRNISKKTIKEIFRGFSR